MRACGCMCVSRCVGSCAGACVWYVWGSACECGWSVAGPAGLGILLHDVAERCVVVADDGGDILIKSAKEK